MDSITAGAGALLALARLLFLPLVLREPAPSSRLVLCCFFRAASSAAVDWELASFFAFSSASFFAFSSASLLACSSASFLASAKKAIGAGDISKGSKPDRVRFAPIPKNFKGAVLTPDMVKAWKALTGMPQ